ncbi:cyclic nucleotide-binding domain-containing protein [Pedobacter sp. LMG 31464]|uniref:Cyclic nucleotide-binding domain-containing protein n=1 Tax=Pedobacter planticolens TaxID=2679964 RepID=A0A923IUP0_9SPHI|nr:Crp/Fnr family transcriptional regulator [Pedobacter planticolens]MBB2145096.1 cyclic nucleotide-binding domain-containing protein [Pedobacter planticolens]
MKLSTTKCDQGTCFLCQSVLKSWLPLIELNKKNFEIKKGQQIFKEGDPVKGIYFVFEGKVKVHKYWDEEKEFIVRFANKGDILGHLGLGTESFYPVSATALEKVVVCYLDMEFFESTLEVNTKFTYNLMRFFVSELQNNDRRMRDLAHMSVKARIAQSFLSLKKQFGVDENNFIDLEITRQDLSAFSGVSYETFFKVMVELNEQNGVIAVDKQYKIVDENLLLKIVQDDQQKQAAKRKLK